MELSREEFLIMKKELLEQEPPCYDMMITLAKRILEPQVNSWCRIPILNGKGYEGDILGEAYLRLMQCVIPGFLLKNGVNGAVNDDHIGFKKWMIKIASNIRYDYIKYENKRLKNIVGDEQSAEGTEPEVESQEDRISMLQEAFYCALDYDTAVYKTLTWLALSIFMLKYDISKIDSTKKVDEVFAEKTLNEMYAILRSASREIPWMYITPDRDRRIKEALDRPYDENISYGETKYSAFYMKKGGKMSISDWVNRINSKIRRAQDDGASDNGRNN